MSTNVKVRRRVTVSIVTFVKNSQWIYSLYTIELLRNVVGTLYPSQWSR